MSSEDDIQDIISFDQSTSMGAVEVVASHTHDSELSSSTISSQVGPDLPRVPAPSRATVPPRSNNVRPHTATPTIGYLSKSTSVPVQVPSRPSTSSGGVSPSMSISSSRSSSLSISSYGNGTSGTGSGKSARKLLTDFIATEPSNRSCADCNCLLIDFTKMYASFCITTMDDVDDAKKANINGSETNELGTGKKLTLNVDFNNFHKAFTPPSSPQHVAHSDGSDSLQQGGKSMSPSNSRRRKRRLGENPRDEVKVLQSIPHGVFICQACYVAHREMAHDFHDRSLHSLARKYGNSAGSMGYTTEIRVKNVTLDQWTHQEVQTIIDSGGNAASNNVLERYYNIGKEDKSDIYSAYTHQSNQGTQELMKRPHGDSSKETRELFIRAKYQALAFSLPNGSASLFRMGISRKRIMDGIRLENGNGTRAETPRAMAVSEPLPNRLVDYFCIVSSNGKIEVGNGRGHHDLSKLRSPDELQFETEITDCFPHPGGGGGPPGHLTKFVFPDGCKPRKSQMPTLFTFTLTNENGTKLYGAALHIYDTYLDLHEIRDCIDDSGYDGDLPQWLDEQHDTNYIKRGKNGSSGSSSVSSNSASKAALVTGHEQDLFFLPKCLVILSHYGFYDAWRKFLLQIYHISIVKAPLPLERYIANFVCEVPLPPMGRIAVKVTLADDQSISISRPPINRLPMVGCSYRPLFACLSVSNIMVVVGCLLQETRVALCSKHCALLTPCCEALVSFLFPFIWQGIYIPIVPTSMVVDLLDAPVPFLVGTSSAYLTEVSIDKRPNGVVLVDLDKDEIHLGYEESLTTEPHGRLPPFLPERDASKLKVSLETFGGCEYIVPVSEKKGRITYCGQKALPNEQRGTYCRTSYVRSLSGIGSSRSDRLAEVDRAFLDDEHLMPIDFSVGTLTGSSDVNDANWKLKGMKKKVKTRTRRRTHVTETASHDSSHLLDINSPYESFDPNAIRNAFLRFLVALFQDYEKCIEYATEERRRFVKDKFISYAESKSFISEIVTSQMFDIFIEEKLLGSDENPNIKFFDDSIVAKRNRSKSTVGRKRETSFLNDNTGKIVETFIPPAPSNQGIQDNSFRYNCFPRNLNHSLFGKIRSPKKLQDVKTQISVRQSAITRSSVRSSEAMKHKIMSQLLKPHSGPSMKHVEKDVNWALHAIVYRGDGDHIIAPDLLEKAWDILFDARSHQLLQMVGIIIIQRRWVAHQPYLKNIHNDRRNWIRAPAMRRSWRRLKSSVSMIQAHYRRKHVRSLFQSAILFVSKIQAAIRGFITRRRVYAELNKRVTSYREQIVLLWDRVYTPLFYRSRFWILDKLPLFLSHALHEEELAGLYRNLGIELTEASENTDTLLVESAVHKTFLQVKLKLDESCVDQAIFPAETDTRSTLALNLTLASEQVALERVQIYERLQKFPRKNDILRLMKIKDSKMKKLSIALSVWSNDIDKSISATIIHSLFPELSTSANINATIPSKKGLTRLSLTAVSNPLPKPLERAMHIESKIDTLILKNMVTVTKSAFTIPMQDMSRQHLYSKTHVEKKNIGSHEKVKKFVQTGSSL